MTNSPRRYLEVAAGVCLRQDGSFLLAQRPPGKPYAGYWEFPGGKMEPGESAAHALVRELREELGIEPVVYSPWITRTHHYTHASVRLHFFRITQWRGEFVCREGQQISWQQAGVAKVSPMLPANGPILRALRLPSLLGISQATELGPDQFHDRMREALSAGLRFVMLREKTWTDEELLHHGSELLKTCRLWQAMMVLNSDPRLAHTLGADGVHLTSARLMQTESRPDLPWCGASCHDEAELQRAARLGLDYVVLGPVRPTPSHPGRTGMGWKAFRELGTNYPLPIYALGGLTSGDLITAWGQGAHGVAMMRAAWTG